MSSEEILGKLFSKFPEHYFTLVKSPLFLEDVVNLSGDLVLCYNVRPKNFQTFQDCTSKSLSIIPEVSICSGNPLENPSYLEESILSATVTEIMKPTISSLSSYSPLTSFQALKIINFYKLKLEASVPLVVLCEGNVKIVEDRKLKLVNRVIHYALHGEASNISGWSDSYKIDSSSVENLKLFEVKHLNKFSCPPEKITSSQMNITAKTLLTQIHDVVTSEECCTIHVQFKWNSYLVKPPMDNCISSLIVNSKLNCAPSLGLAITWRQLVLLQKYLDWLEHLEITSEKNPKNIVPSAKDFLREFGLMTEDLSGCSADEEMEKLLRTPIETLRPSTIQLGKFSKLTDFICDPTRLSSDITHLLWTKLIGCDSYQSLQAYFRSFFKQASSSSNVPLKSKWTQKTNVSMVAHIIQADRVLVNSYVEFINPIDCLVEIGIDKLRHDVTTLIFDCVKVPPSCLEIPALPKFSDIANRNEWFKVCRKWLAWLSRLYSSINILYCVDKALGGPQLMHFLSVTYDVVAQLCSKDDNNVVDIKSMYDLLENPQRSLTHEIPARLLSSSLFDTEFFDEWVLTFNSSSLLQKVKSIFYRSPNCPLPYIHEENNISDGNDTNNTTIGGNITACLSNTLCLENVPCKLQMVESHFITDQIYDLNKCTA